MSEKSRGVRTPSASARSRRRNEGIPGVFRAFGNEELVVAGGVIASRDFSDVLLGSGTSIRLRIGPDLAERYDHLKRRVQTVAAPNASFIAFLALSLFDAWLPTLRQFRDKWGHIYRRDRFQCSSPVCSRCDVTPHHLRFQSQGGGHEEENLISLCSFCHLEGVHAGRIQARPPASNIEWTLGRHPLLKVTGATATKPVPATVRARARTCPRSPPNHVSSRGL